MSVKLMRSYEISELPPSEARKEYQRLRRLTERRLATLERRDLMDYLEDYPDLPLSSKLTDLQVYRQLQEVTRFLKSPYSSFRTIQNLEKNMISKFRESGYDFVTPRNIKDVNRYMGLIKNAVGDANFNSDKALEYIEQMERLNISSEDFEKRIDEYLNFDPEQLETVKPIKTGREMKYNDLVKRLGRK